MTSAKGVVAALLALGAAAVATQIILLREFLSVFHGNELVIGIVLAWWMVLTGTGSFLGRSSHRWAPRRWAIPLALLALGFTMLGEGLAEILNPRLLER